MLQEAGAVMTAQGDAAKLKTPVPSFSDLSTWPGTAAAGLLAAFSVLLSRPRA